MDPLLHALPQGVIKEVLTLTCILILVIVPQGHSIGIGVVKEVQPGWVRFCANEDYFDIFANQCPAGFFWKPDYKSNKQNWDCVCTRGPWRRSNKWCSGEETKRFTEGDISCFDVNKGEENLEGMQYLGDEYSGWDSSEPILLTSYKSGIAIRNSDLVFPWKLPQMKNNDPGVLIYRPRDDWTVEDKSNPTLRLCLRAPPPDFDESRDGTYIYDISKLFSNSSSSSIDKKKRKKKPMAAEHRFTFSRTCFSWDKDDGKTWFEVVGESLEDKNMVVPKYNNKTASEACKRCMRIPVPDSPKTDIYGQPLKPPQKRIVEDLKYVGVLTSEINLQTERLGLYWANRLLKDESDYVKDNPQEMEILTKAAIMAYGTCDLNHIPKPFYQYFLLMFRRLLSDSFKKYAPVSPINPVYYDQINGLLDKCAARTGLINFTLDESCPPKYIQYTSANGTEPIEKDPKDYDAKPTRHDYLLEFVWRLKSFMHYNCFQEFKDDSVLHDLIQNQLETLFTEDIILRWFNPSLAFKMYDHIFKHQFDLRTVMRNFEQCTRAVHKISGFPVWLKRPIDQPHRVQQGLLLKRKKRDVSFDYFYDSSEHSMNKVDEVTLNEKDKKSEVKVVFPSEVDKKKNQEVKQQEPQDEDEIETEDEESSNKLVLKRETEKVNKDKDKEGDDSESGETFYQDSKEQPQRPPEAGNSPYNMFSTKKVDGFLGACISSVKLFKEAAKQDMDSCW